MPIHVEVVSQERMLFDEPEADYVSIPGSEGMMGILPNHTPLISTMGFGELIVRKGDAEEAFAVYGGVVEVRPDKVVVLADAADFASDLNLKEAEEARERILKLLEEGVPPADEAFVAAQLKRAELTMDVVRKTRSRSGGVGIRVVTEKKDDE